MDMYMCACDGVCMGVCNNHPSVMSGLGLHWLGLKGGIGFDFGLFFPCGCVNLDGCDWIKGDKMGYLSNDSWLEVT